MPLHIGQSAGNISNFDLENLMWARKARLMRRIWTRNAPTGPSSVHALAAAAAATAHNRNDVEQGVREAGDGLTLKSVSTEPTLPSRNGLARTPNERRRAGGACCCCVFKQTVDRWYNWWWNTFFKCCENMQRTACGWTRWLNYIHYYSQRM